jgi:putative oxidoreductase
MTAASSKGALLRHAIALSLAAVFLYAAWFKIRDPNGFATDLRNYKHSPGWSVHPMAIVAPWWEVTAALAVLLPSWRRAGALLLAVMGVVFLVSVSQALIRGLDISCGCFGHTEGHATRAGIQTLSLDTYIIVTGLYLAWRARRDLRAAPAGDPQTALA